MQRVTLLFGLGLTILLATCSDQTTTPEPEPESKPVIRIVTFGDSNTDQGWASNNPNHVARSYISRQSDGTAVESDDSHHPTQLAGKLETTWGSKGRQHGLIAVNHGIGGTNTGPGRHGGTSSPHARASVDGTTRFEAEALGANNLWNGGETNTTHYPDGPIDRAHSFTPTENDFLYVSMGTNDQNSGLSVEETLANLEWMIDRWLGQDLPAEHFLLTTLAPYEREKPRASHPGYGEDNPARNAGIRALAETHGVHIIDLADHVSDDDGLTWRSDEFGVDDVHYSEQVRDWLADRVVEHITEVVAVH